MLQGCQIYKGCCELDLYFASEFICGCEPYIPRYKLDYKPPRTSLIPWQLPTRDYRDSSLMSSRRQPTSYLHETDLNSICYDAHDRTFIIEGNKEKTLEDEYMNRDVQVQEHGQLSDISIGSMNQELEVGGCKSYGNEVHNERMFIGNSNFYSGN